MNNEIRAYSKNAVKAMGFPTREYKFPTGAGGFTGTLILKEWADRNGLICYFETDEGEKYKLCVWYNKYKEKAYRPKKSGPALNNVLIGTKLRVEYEPSSTGGSTKWTTAEIVE